MDDCIICCKSKLTIPKYGSLRYISASTPSEKLFILLGPGSIVDSWYKNLLSYVKEIISTLWAC